MAKALSSLLLGLGQLLDGAVLRILLKSVLVTFLVFIIVAGLGWLALDYAFAIGGLEDALFAGAGELRAVASAIIALIGLWLTWRIVALAVIQFYAEDIVTAVERKHYPQEAQRARELPLSRQIGLSLRGAGRALLVNIIALPFALALLFTGIGTALLFWLVNAVLLGRELQNMVWLRQPESLSQAAPVGAGERFLLGGAVAAMLALPFVHFLAPVFGAASATHLIHRQTAKLPA